jgi:hypothetical protein
VVKDGNLEGAIKHWLRLEVENRRIVRSRSFFIGPAETRRLKQRRNARKIKRRAAKGLRAA